MLNRSIHLLMQWAALWALLLSSLAMQPAAAAPMRGIETPAPGHCGDDGPADRQEMKADCTMGCASALPAVPLLKIAEPTEAQAPAGPAGTRSLQGLGLETEIPPPRA
jgi:hypothetical protein